MFTAEAADSAVYVVGEVASPGAYDVSSLSTPLNALFAAGGVTERGSLRRLEHYRGKQLVEEVDAYDLLLHGIRGEVKRLENGDSLRVPPLGISVTVEGMVRRRHSTSCAKRKAWRGSRFGGRDPAGGGAAAHRSATAGRA